MKLNEIAPRRLADEYGSFSSMKSFMDAHTLISNIIKDLMMEEEIDGQYFRQLMQLKSDFTWISKSKTRFHSLSEAAAKFNRKDNKCAFAVHTRYNIETGTFDDVGPFIAMCVKIDGKYYRIDTDAGNYYEQASNQTMFTSLRHDLDDIGSGTPFFITYYGWLIFV